MANEDKSPLNWPMIAFAIIMILAIVLIGRKVAHEDTAGTSAGTSAGTCFEQHKVVTILNVHYPGADIQLDNDQIITVNQATLQPGDFYCTRYGR